MANILNNFKTSGTNTKTLGLQWGKVDFTGTNIGGGSMKSFTIPLNYSFSNTYYIPNAIHDDGNQMNIAIADSLITKTVSKFGITIRNINTSTKADVNYVYWYAVGY